MTYSVFNSNQRGPYDLFEPATSYAKPGAVLRGAEGPRPPMGNVAPHFGPASLYYYYPHGLL